MGRTLQGCRKGTQRLLWKPHNWRRAHWQHGDPRLEAKPIIDIMVGVASLNVSDEFITDLQRIGYEHRRSDTIIGRLFFAKGPESNRTHNLSVCETGSPFWVGRVAFREALRANQELAQQYGTLKRLLAQQYPHNRLAYTEAKEPFILSVIASTQSLGI